jgi:hypothetical protein
MIEYEAHDICYGTTLEAEVPIEFDLKTDADLSFFGEWVANKNYNPFGTPS